jgi:hypothetical protein
MLRSCRMWTIVLALAGPWLTLGVARQLYTAAMRGYIMTGHSMNRRVHREEEPTLFRNNVIANIAIFPLVAGGTALFVADAVRVLFR